MGDRGCRWHIPARKKLHIRVRVLQKEKEKLIKLYAETLGAYSHNVPAILAAEVE